MTTITALGTTRSAGGRPGPLAGATYVGAWLVGLVVVSGPALDAGKAEISAHYAGHGAAAVTQSLLVHGVAAGALAAVAILVGRRSAGRARTVTRASGLTAAFLSLVQMVCGIVAVADIDSGPAMFETLSRLDGVKMVALATFTASLLAIARSGGIARWIGWTGVATAAALVPAAAAYLTMTAALAAAAAPALLLLLVTVCAAGVETARG